MAADREGPTGPFKRALSLAMKTISGEPELIVTFGADTPAISGGRAKLPQLSHDMPDGEVAITRGIADAFALRIANHDDALHLRYRPPGKLARMVFEAVEQARVEAIGSNSMPGMAHNLSAMLDHRFERRKGVPPGDRKDAPLEDALALMVRERLTGAEPPEAAAALVELWRPWIEEKARRQLERLGDAIYDQQQFARMSRDLIAALDMAGELGEDPDETEESSNEDPEEGDAASEDQEKSDQQAEAATSEEVQEGEGETEESLDDAAEISAD